MAQWIKNPSSIHENVGLIPGPIQWVKNPLWPQAAMQVAHVAWIQSGSGCGVGQQL